MCRFFALSLLLILVSHVDLQKTLPATFPSCRRNDPALNNCLLKATEQIRPIFKNGVPELNIAVTVPYFIPKIHIKEDTAQANFTADLLDISVSGLDSYKFEKFGFDPKTLKFDGALKLDHVNFNGNYTVDGKIFGIPIQGKGGCDITVGDIAATFDLTTKLVTKHGTGYLELQKFNLKLKILDLKYTYNGLFEDYPRLAKAADEAIKQFEPQIKEILTPVSENTVVNILSLELFKKLFRVPYDKLFPEK